MRMSTCRPATVGQAGAQAPLPSGDFVSRPWRP